MTPCGWIPALQVATHEKHGGQNLSAHIRGPCPIISTGQIPRRGLSRSKPMHFFLRLLIAFDKLPSREIVPIYTPTSRDWHPGRLWVVNERKLRGEKAGGEEKGKGREAWRERMQRAPRSSRGPPGTSPPAPESSSERQVSQPTGDCTRLSPKATIQSRRRTKLEQRLFDPF